MQKIQKHIKLLVTTLALVGILVMPYFVFASSTALKKLEKVGPQAGFEGADETSFAEIIGGVVSTALGFLGVIFVILIIYAGYNWMTAAGEEEKVRKAQDTIKRAVIGLIITTSAYAIWNFVFYRLV